MIKKKVALITLYDMTCYGTRLLSAIINNCGLESHLIHLKREKYAPLLRRKDQFRTYQFHYNGILRGSFYAVDRITNQEILLLISKLEQISPSLIALSTRSFSYNICRLIFPKIKKRFPDVPIVSGGWGPTLEPDCFLEFSDYVCVGEGERTIRDICHNLRNNEEIKNVSNLGYKRGSVIYFNPIEPALKPEELSSLPFPDYSQNNKHLISNNKAESGKLFLNSNVYDIFAARGCPLSCTYCLSSKYSNIYKEYSGRACPKYRLRAHSVVIEELVQAKKRGAKFIRFRDEVFPIHSDWINIFLADYTEKIDLPFFAYIRPEFHSPELIEKLKKAGLTVTFVGIQSGSEEIRKQIYHRKLSKEKIIEFANTLEQLDIQFAYHFIYGNPFEKEKHLIESIEFTHKLPYRNAFFYKLEPFPGTPIKKMIETDRPDPLDPKISDWYVLLHCMSLNSPRLRMLSTFILKRKLFKKHPFFITIFFVPSLVKEILTTIENKFFLKAPFQYFRARKG